MNIRNIEKLIDQERDRGKRAEMNVILRDTLQQLEKLTKEVQKWKVRY